MPECFFFFFFELDTSARFPYKHFETRVNCDFHFEYRPKCLDSVLNIVRAIMLPKLRNIGTENIFHHGNFSV